MIAGTGIDIIEISRVERVLARYNRRLESFLFTDAEQEYCCRGSSRRAHAVAYAGRFAAKEALVKALGTGLRHGIRWKDIEILNDELGKPHIELSDIALQKLKEINAHHIHLSISHSRDYAAAFVVLEKTGI